MPNETNTPQDEETLAARRILGMTPRQAALAGGAVVLAGAVVLGPTISNEIKKDDRASSLSAENTHNTTVLTEIHSDALAKVDPANIVGMFMINEQSDTINQISLDIAHSQPEYIHGDQATKDFIDYTILESGKAQGSYNLGDNFVETKAKIDGKDTLIVQDATGVAEQLQQQQLSTPDGDGSTIPTVDTH
ncbi:MAG: hypothetical protein JWO99_465 [Candidatus Saccharibacteria bacterium]|nr:hypothetical protein [Candidatus Saccharibacteria bacterium]